MKLRVKRIIFVVAVCVAAMVCAIVRWPMHFQTDLTSLLNIGVEENWPLQNITDKFSSVVNIVVKSADRIDGEVVAQKIRGAVTSGDFPELNVWVNDLSPRVVVSTVGKYHNAIISANDRELLHSGQFTDLTQNAVQKIETSMMPNLMPLSQDPFLLFTNYMAEMGGGGTNWMPNGSLLWQYRAPYNFYMLPISVNVSNNAELVDSIARLRSVIADVKTDKVQVYMGGAPLHTAEMYQHSKIELGVISVLALIAVVIINYLLFRRMKPIVPIGISLAVGYLAGTVALFLCFCEPHILVFVFGTSLIGLGIDYGFHFMCAKNDVHAVHKNILHSLITTLICFAPLGFASIGLLRQISVFTIVGLVTIYAFIKLFVPTIASNIRPTRAVQSAPKKYRPYIILGITVLALVACAFARIENNMSAMYRPNKELAVAEKVIGDLNQSGQTAFLVVRGADAQSVLETEEEIRDAGVQFFGVSSVVPSLKRQSENNNLVRELYKSQAKNIKKSLGLKVLPQFVPADTLTIENEDLGALKQQIERLLVNIDGNFYSVSSISADAVIANENARVIAPARQIQNQMEKFSHETYWLLIICGLVLVGGLVVLYGRRAGRYLMPPLMGVIVSVAILTILGMPITFFHLLGLFIVIGLGMDYAIFHINMKKNAELRPVFYSFLTSFIGFGLLAFTSFFLIAAMGMILAIGIAVSYIVSLYLFRD